MSAFISRSVPFGRSFALTLDGRAEPRLLVRLALLGRKIPDAEIHREILVGRSARALHEPLEAFGEDLAAQNGVILRFVPARAGVGVTREFGLYSTLSPGRQVWVSAEPELGGPLLELGRGPFCCVFGVDRLHEEPFIRCVRVSQARPPAS